MMTLVWNIDQAATSRKDPTALVDQLQTAFQSSMNNLNGASLAKTSNAVVIDASVNIIAVFTILPDIFLIYPADAVRMKDIVVALGRFAVVDVDLSVRVDAFVSAFVSALDKTSPGLGAEIGAA